VKPDDPSHTSAAANLIYANFRRDGYNNIAGRPPSTQLVIVIRRYIPHVPHF